MRVGNNHQMAVAVGITVQHHIRFHTTVQYQIVVATGEFAEQTFGRAGVGFDVCHAPGRPDSVHLGRGQ